MKYSNIDGEDKTLLTDEQRKKLVQIYAIRSVASTVGVISGAYLAYKKDKGFWGYVGFMILGSIVIGGLVSVATMPMRTKLANDMLKSVDEQKKKNETQVVNTSTNTNSNPNTK